MSLFDCQPLPAAVTPASLLPLFHLNGTALVPFENRPVLTGLTTECYVAQAGPFSVGWKSQNDDEISVHVLQIINLRFTAN